MYSKIFLWDTKDKSHLKLSFYIGAGNGLASDESYSEEFHVLKQDDFKAKDLKLTKIFDDSESGVASYRLPTKIVDGIYTGCKACGQDGGISHGGNWSHHWFSLPLSVILEDFDI